MSAETSEDVVDEKNASTTVVVRHVFDPVQMIRIRRDQIREHTDEELAWWIQEYTAGRIPQYQMSAWLMAVCFRGLSARETATLTKCMVQSGIQLDWKSHFANDAATATLPQDQSPAILVDKHSTGGVGDKVSLLLAPLVCSLGVRVPMIAGRGLGHTGGTIDKLESIPSFRTNLAADEFAAVVLQQRNEPYVAGAAPGSCCIASAGPNLCPADRKLYALRDVTSTVRAIPLQTASIMCKKIAEHPGSLVLDCKYGSGAFQATAEDAAELAHSMVQTGEANGLRPTTAFLTNMNQPLGYAVGNWIEVQESIQILKGSNKSSDHYFYSNLPCSYDLIALVCMQAGQMLLQSGLYPNKSLDELVTLAFDTLVQGHALKAFQDMALAQGADPDFVAKQLIRDPSSSDTEYVYPPVPVYATSDASQDATYFIHEINALELGLVGVELGAGRREADQPVDFHAGVRLAVKIGSSVKVSAVSSSTTNSSSNSILAWLHGPPDKVTPAVIEQARVCFKLMAGPVPQQTIVTHRVTADEGLVEIVALPACLQVWYPPC